MNTKALKVFFVYTIVLAFFVLFSILELFVFKSKSAYLFTIKLYGLVEYCLFATFLYQLYQSTLAKKIIIFSIIPFVIISIVNYYISLGSNFSNYPLLIEFLAFIVFIIYFFYEKMNTVVEYPLYQSISFWISMGLFIYFTGNFFFFLFINSSKDKDFMTQMRTIYSLVTITKNIILCVAFFATEKIETQEDILHIPSELDLDSFNPKTTLN